MNIAIVGAGYVGLVTGACLAEAGHDVTCVDADPKRVEAIEHGQAFFYEPGLQDVLDRHAGTRLRATTDIASVIASTDLTMIAVGTPTVDGSIDLRHIEASAQAIGAALRGLDQPHVVVVKSTVLPGTTSDVVRPIVERASGRTSADGLHVAMNPEFLREGNAVADFADPDRVVLGVDDPAAEALLRELYAPLSPGDVIVTNPRTAETIKYASNALLATLISFSNEIGNLAARLPGVDARTVMAGVKADDRWSPRQPDGTRVRPGVLSYLEAGCGFGGSCFPKDVQALRSFVRGQGLDSRVLDAVLGVNERQPDQVIRLLEQGLGELEGRTVGVLGLAFKPDTDDVRESPSLALIRTLRARGAHVRAYDPFAGATARAVVDDAVNIVERLDDALEGADGVAVMTAWPEFETVVERLDAQRGDDQGPWLVDGRRSVAAGEYSRYLAIGLGPS